MAKLFVIAGHGAGDCGAVGNGYTEAERVRALATRIKSLGGDNVLLGDFNRNYYEDAGIASLSLSSEYCIIELHMDSGVQTARGGHVIIDGTLTPDSYDNALANMLKQILPGRSSMIVQRSDLANPQMATAKGYNYRLVEFGFITNVQDVNIFNNRMDEIATGVLNAFGIKTNSNVKVIDGEIRSGGTFQKKEDKFGDVSYQVHARGIGWCNWQCDGLLAGSTGQNRRIEAIRINVAGNVDVSVHMRGIGDRTYKNVTKDTICGTIGEQRRIEAIKITGKDKFYLYRVHQKGIGWSDWANNGEWAGVKGKSLQIEAIEIKEAMFSVDGHVQGKGWIGERAAENIIGITGHALRLEAIRINPYGKKIKAKAHIQTDGWIDYGTITSETIIGTTGQKKRIECLCFEGDFEYRVHIQGSGWTNWTKADGIATLGTVGQALRIEAIQFR